MERVLERFKEDLEYAAVSEETERKYMNIATEFLKQRKGGILRLDDDDAKKYLIEKRKTTSHGYQMQLYYCLLKLFRSIKKDKRFIFPFDPPKAKPGDAPKSPVFSIPQVREILNLAHHKSFFEYIILRTGYASGLGVKELTYLDKSDLFKKHGYYFIKNRWGGKSRARNVPIDRGTYDLLKKSFRSIKRDNNAMFVYPKKRSVKAELVGKRVSEWVVTRLVTKYKEKCGIDLERASSHTLFRRCYATHREMMSVQTWGHSSQYEIDIDLGHNPGNRFVVPMGGPAVGGTATAVTQTYIPFGKDPDDEPEYSLKTRAINYEKTHPLAVGEIVIED